MSRRAPPRAAPATGARRRARPSRPNRSTREPTVTPSSRGPASASPQTMATGTESSRAEPEDTRGHLATQRLRVQPTLAGDHEIGRRDARRQTRAPRPPRRRPGRMRAPRNAISPNPRPPAAPAPGSSRRSTPRSRCTTAARCPSARSSTTTSSGVAPFCGAVHGARARRPGERVVHVGRGHARHAAGDAGRCAVASIRARPSEGGAARLRSPAPRSSSKPHAERLRHPRSPVVGGAPARADEEPRRARDRAPPRSARRSRGSW